MEKYHSLKTVYSRKMENSSRMLRDFLSEICDIEIDLLEKKHLDKLRDVTLTSDLKRYYEIRNILLDKIGLAVVNSPWPRESSDITQIEEFEEKLSEYQEGAQPLILIDDYNNKAKQPVLVIGSDNII
jgi:hypothetical protein